ncbi:protein ABHD15 [Tiliqua scincoides]|uniref:protein ABHD15 n=1 Tax=Tiliqua scincoides TaxID=71010 RepID=UPI003461B064
MVLCVIVGFILLGLLAWWLQGHGVFFGSFAVDGGQRGPTKVEERSGGVNFSEKKGSLVRECLLICKPSALAQALLKSFRRSADLEASGWAWKSWPNLQTIAQLLWPPAQPLEFARDHLQLADNGIIALDWVVGPWKSNRKATNTGDSLVLLVVPSAAGQITRNIQQLCQLALGQGYYPVIFNRRGHNSCPLTSPRLQPFGDPSDLKEAVAYIRFRHPTATLFAISEGSGSGLLLSYLGECGSSSYLGGAACISPLLKCQEWFEAGAPWWYEWSQLLSLKRSISRHAKALREVTELDGVLGSCSLQDFEEALFCRRKSHVMTWEAYWDCNDPLRDVDEVAVPVLCVCSVDDPIRGPPEDTLPWELFQSNPYFFLLLTPCGGHCGFLRKGSSPSFSSWGNMVILEYLQTLVEFFHMEERMTERPFRSSIVHQRLRWGNLPHREASPLSVQLHQSFSWQRSYTR